MKTKIEFEFDPNKSCRIKLCDSKGNCCVIGQFLNKHLKISKKRLRGSADEHYRLFAKVVGCKYNDVSKFYKINDSALTMNRIAISELKKLFLEYGIKMTVKKRDK